jgi:hypothetical protein
MKPAAADADVHLAMCRPASTPTGARDPSARVGFGDARGVVDSQRTARPRWATLPHRGTRHRRPGFRRAHPPTHPPTPTSPKAPTRGWRVRVVAGAVGGCLVLGGCVSVRPLELVPADRVAQTSLVVDAGGRAVAALHGPEDRTAVPLGR